MVATRPVFAFLAMDRPSSRLLRNGCSGCCLDFLRRWRQWIRPVCFAFYFICLVIALPWCIVELNRKGAPDYVQAWFIGGIFVMMAVPISLWGILQHLVNYTQPHLQRHIIRILWMVPIYALNAWFAMRFPSAAIYLDTMRECYEAYVIYNFVRYLLNFLEQEHPQLELFMENKPPVKQLIPCCCLPPWHHGKQFLNRTKHGVLQYSVVRPAMTVIAVITQLTGHYDEGNYNFTSAWSYTSIINNASQIWAVYCLLMFYKGCRVDLAPIKPLRKFLCIKAVVFFSFWQSVVIAALTKSNVIPSDHAWVFYHNTEEVATGLQDFLICVEMFLAAIAHYFSFSHKPFVDAAAPEGNCCSSFLTMWDIRDVRDDVIDHARYIGQGVQKKFAQNKTDNSASATSEYTPLLTSQDPSVMADSEVGPGQPPSTPQIVMEENLNTPKEYDARSLPEDDLQRSHHKSSSLTSSMNNYLEFSTSADVNSKRVEDDEKVDGNGEVKDDNPPESEEPVVDQSKENASLENQHYASEKNLDDKTSDDQTDDRVPDDTAERTLGKSTTVNV